MCPAVLGPTVPQSVTLDPVADRETVAEYLERADLPTADLADSPGTFYAARAGDDLVAVGGVEAHGTDGLLRSLVVVPERRGEGYGAATCAALEDAAHDAGVETLYLLTTTAAAFFAAQGYEEFDRASAPERIRATAEFAEVCPASATAMRRSL